MWLCKECGATWLGVEQSSHLWRSKSLIPYVWNEVKVDKNPSEAVANVLMSDPEADEHGSNSRHCRLRQLPTFAIQCPPLRLPFPFRDQGPGRFPFRLLDTRR